jgi:hypothetical protein
LPSAELSSAVGLPFALEGLPLLPLTHGNFPSAASDAFLALVSDKLALLALHLFPAAPAATPAPPLILPLSGELPTFPNCFTLLDLAAAPAFTRKSWGAVVDRGRLSTTFASPWRRFDGFVEVLAAVFFFELRRILMAAGEA